MCFFFSGSEEQLFLSYMHLSTYGARVGTHFGSKFWCSFWAQEFVLIWEQELVLILGVRVV